MDPLITDGIDPALLRIVDRRGQERDPEMRRKRAPAARESEDESDNSAPDPSAPKHELDDLA